jgi:hypothetical protein
MTDIAPAAAASAQAAPSPVEQMTVEQARATIEARKGDRDFYNRLQKQDPSAHAEWTGLHKRAFPAPATITLTQDVNNQAAARREQGWSDYLAMVRQDISLTPEQEASVRAGEVDEQLYKRAQEDKERLIRDRAWYQRLVNGDREARHQWAWVRLVLSPKPVA